MRVPEMIARRLLLAFLLIGTFSAKAATYQDIFNPRSIVVISKNAVTLVDVEKPATSCAESEQFVCIRSQSLMLGISRDAAATKWSFAGSHYRVLGADERGVLGESFAYKTIKISGALNFQISYSRTRGILAIKEPTGNTLVLHEKCGCQSAATCVP